MMQKPLSAAHSGHALFQLKVAAYLKMPCLQNAFYRGKYVHSIVFGQKKVPISQENQRAHG